MLLHYACKRRCTTDNKRHNKRVGNRPRSQAATPSCPTLSPMTIVSANAARQMCQMRSIDCALAACVCENKTC